MQYFGAEPDAYCSRRLSHLIAQLSSSLPASTNSASFVLSAVGSSVTSPSAPESSIARNLFLLDQLAEYSPLSVWSPSTKSGVSDLLGHVLGRVTDPAAAAQAETLRSAIVALAAVAKASAGAGGGLFAASNAQQQQPQLDESAAFGTRALPPLLACLSLLLQRGSADHTTAAFQALVELATQAPGFFAESSEEALGSVVEACLQTARAEALDATNR